MEKKYIEALETAIENLKERRWGEEDYREVVEE